MALTLTACGGNTPKAKPFSGAGNITESYIENTESKEDKKLSKESVDNENLDIINNDTKKSDYISDDDIPKEYKNALKSAETLSNSMNMSKQGIYDQLVSEHGGRFPNDAAQYSIDYLNADYKKNALKKAESYQNSMSMSNQAIYEQLISEHGSKFTKEEAQYAVDNLK